MSNTETLDRAVADLVRGEEAWAACGVARRRDLLEQVHAATAAQAEAWVRAAAAYKRLPDDSPLLGEEWMSGPYAVLMATASLAESARALEAGKSPVDAFSFGGAPGGRVSVRVLPHTTWDRLLLGGFTAEVWMPPGVTADEVRERAGLGLRTPDVSGGVGVVLGAGNITSIPVLDVLYELYAHNRVVVLKLNPVTDGLLDVFTAVLAPLIAVDAVRIVTGGADAGEHLVHHPQIGHVHMTGSAATHDAIVFGAGEEGAARKQAGTPVLDKPVTSELGGVSPTIVVPGRWTDADLRYQAEHVATQRLHNGGYNCIAGQVVVVGADWPQKERFLAHLRAVLAEAPARDAYYPGSDGRVAQALESYRDAEVIGGRVLLSGLDPAWPGPALTTEYFAPVLGVLELPGDAGKFLGSAVQAANEEFAGTLGVNVIADPRTIAELGPDFDAALAELRYGCVAVNAWTGVGYLTPTASWGAFPGHTLADVQSGIGVVHNAVLLDAPERTVIRGPFRPAPRSLLRGEKAISPKPPWFVTNRTGATTGRRLVEFAAAPRWSALPKLFASALRG
ncbi:aldehyde dehydrogenase family protein [Yinghuangia seranimata]|uniref:aldehyde dehydrogenase family protein n=1 Tax=Yinghuangia seranimata TaxID=408067 RepID=UPI00248C62C7|nr:aldehyde dehydrogenase family protein [Yinghuangia seranimata]MDI2124830.1 aldehyde dehydrogenase family protein [Yinghuangia seranimata]